MNDVAGEQKFQIITFYEFKRLDALEQLQAELKALMHKSRIRGTILLAQEGFNSTICGTPEDIEQFVPEAGKLLRTTLVYKSSFHTEMPHRKIDVKIRPEIVTLKRPVDMSRGDGTHVTAAEWNRLITDEGTFVLDTRNDYEYRNGTFRGAVNPSIDKFSDLPDFIEKHLDRAQHKNIAMFCTGGIRCEKFAPYMKGIGFENVYQLDGGILRYLETTPPETSLWEGECFVFDDRRTVDHHLQKGIGPDYSQEKAA